MQTLPINLSLSEDERSPNHRSGSGGGGCGSDQSLTSPHLNKTIAASSGGGFGQMATGGANPDQSPLETADMLYEYFPLSLDDW